MTCIDAVVVTSACVRAGAARNSDTSAPLVSVEQIVREHWARFGRNYYTRYDYESVDTARADAVMAHLGAKVKDFAAAKAASASHGESTPPSCVPLLSVLSSPLLSSPLLSSPLLSSPLLSSPLLSSPLISSLAIGV